MLYNMVSCVFTCMWKMRKEIAELKGGNEKLMMQIALLKKATGLAGCHLRANKGYIALLAANDTENLNEIDNLKANLAVLKDTLDRHEIAYELIPRKTCNPWLRLRWRDAWDVTNYDAAIRACMAMKGIQNKLASSVNSPRS